MTNPISQHCDDLETRDPAAREADLFARLPGLLARAMGAPAWEKHLGSIDAAAITDRAALAQLPVLRKAELPAMQKAAPPFGGFSNLALSSFGRLFTSPGPIFEGEGPGADPWHAARALFAAGFRCGDITLNTFSYHLTPGGMIMDGGARALGCPVIPAGPGQVEQQLLLIQAFQPAAYTGTPDFLNILIDAADRADMPVPFTKALMSGAAFPKSLRQAFAARGIAAREAYATADAGIIAYETPAGEGLVLNEHIILEIVRPGTGDPVPEGEVGEVVVTVLDPHHFTVRLALGDLSAVMPGISPCGRTNTRIKGWMGRADQTAKIKGMFVRPEQIAEVARRHPQLTKLRLVITRADERDAMELRAESTTQDAGLAEAVAATLQAVTKLKGAVALLPPGALPNDGKVIADERDFS